MMHCGYFDTTRNGNTLVFWHRQWLVGDARSPSIFVESDPPTVNYADLAT